MKMTKWYNAHNRETHESRTFRSNNPIGAAFEMLGTPCNERYDFKEISDRRWIVNNKLELKEINNINPFWSLK